MADSSGHHATSVYLALLASVVAFTATDVSAQWTHRYQKLSGVHHKREHFGKARARLRARIENG